MDSIGKYRVVGLNCQKNSPKVFERIAKLGANPDEENWDTAVDWSNSGNNQSEVPKVEGGTSLPNDWQEMRKINARKAHPSLIQLSSFGGHVMLFRSCFFDVLPKELKNLLEGDIVKVGQGLERDRKDLNKGFGTILGCFVDIRRVCCRWPYFNAKVCT